MFLSTQWYRSCLSLLSIMFFFVCFNASNMSITIASFALPDPWKANKRLVSAVINSLDHFSPKAYHFMFYTLHSTTYGTPLPSQICNTFFFNVFFRRYFPTDTPHDAEYAILFPNRRGALHNNSAPSVWVDLYPLKTQQQAPSFRVRFKGPKLNINYFKTM